MVTITGKMARATVEQLDRVNESPEHLKQRIQEQQLIIDRLTAQIERQRRALEAFHRGQSDEPDVQKILQVDGRPIGNQSALARALGVGPDRVSKWHKQRRLQFYFDAAGIEWFYLDQGRPPRKTRGQ